MADIESCPVCESPLVNSDLSRAFGDTAKRCPNRDCLRGEYTPEQQAEYRRFCASPTGTARMMVEARKTLASANGLILEYQDAIEKARTEYDAALAAAESQIAALKVDLADMMRQRDDERRARNECMTNWEYDCRELTGERDAALADLSQARAELEQANNLIREYQAGIEKTRSEYEATLQAERAAHAATRAEMENVKSDRVEGDRRLVELREENAQLKDENTAWHKQHEKAQGERDTEAYAHGLTRHKLGRAVAALRRAQDHVELPMDIDRDLEADSESTAAGEAWEREREERAEMVDMLREVVNAIDLVPTDPRRFAAKAAITLTMLRGGAAAVLTKVDARRAGAPRYKHDGGNDYCDNDDCHGCHHVGAAEAHARKGGR